MSIWGEDDRRLGLVDLGATGRLDAFELASIADMMMALRQQDRTLLREATMEVAVTRRSLDPRQFECALAQFMARHLGPGATPRAAMLTELMQVFLAFGIALPATTTTTFRALATLEGTLEALSPGFPMIESAQDVAALPPSLCKSGPKKKWSNLCRYCNACPGTWTALPPS